MPFLGNLLAEFPLAKLEPAKAEAAVAQAETRYQTLEAKYHDLETKNGALETEKASLETENSRLNLQIQDQKVQMEQQGKVIEELQARCLQLEGPGALDAIELAVLRALSQRDHLTPRGLALAAKSELNKAQHRIGRLLRRQLIDTTSFSSQGNTYVITFQGRDYLETHDVVTQEA